VDEVSAEQAYHREGGGAGAAARHMESLDEETMPLDVSEPPLNSNVAVSRS
jgi:hypothetical protein